MLSAKRDYYRVLGVCQTSTMDEIKKAYRSESKKYHPDLNQDFKLFSEEKMRELVEAYEVLSDPVKKKEYDKQPHFQLRRSRRSSSTLSSKEFTKSQAGHLKKEESLLERVFSPFFRKKDTTEKQIISPKDADVHFTLGLSMSENESFYEQAITEFRLATKFDPMYTEAFWNLGILCYRKGFFEDAEINFQKVLAISKGDASARKMVELLKDDTQ